MLCFLLLGVNNFLFVPSFFCDDGVEDLVDVCEFFLVGLFDEFLGFFLEFLDAQRPLVVGNSNTLVIGVEGFVVFFLVCDVRGWCFVVCFDDVWDVVSY